MVRLSHSSKNKYLQCSEKWRLHYQEKIRTRYLSSSLVFGSAVDDAFGRLLLEKKNNLTEYEQHLMKVSAEFLFDKNFVFKEHNKKEVDVRDFEYMQYTKKDYDPSMIEESDALEIQEKAKELELDVYKDNYNDFIEACREVFKAKNKVSREEQKLYNFIHWKSLRNKGLYLIGKYREVILPLIHEVHSIQREVKLEDGDDVFTGYIDFEASFVDDPDTIYTIDNKTASSMREYGEGCVERSSQLASYCEFTERNTAAYIVVEKELRKRDPRFRIHVIKGEIPEETFEEVFEEIEEVREAIKARQFEKLPDKKKCFFFGKPCEYVDFCWKDGSMKGLVNLKEKDGSK